MSIKADKWIRRMAREHGMIEPFEPGQVRERDGQRIVSYGTSSYGYDVRCASEFKIFTNINSTIVDPKRFDEKSFVDFTGEVCIIPPNSFALARTVEYFRVPRNVLIVTLGKSTYARCFRGDTRVALVDGSAPSLEEMVRRHDGGELFWGYSVGPNGRLIVTLLDAPRYIGRDSLIEVELDNGAKIHATPDHEFLLRDGRTSVAGLLKPGDSVMPLYRQLVRGHETVYQPLDGHLLATHRLADEWNVRNGIYADTAGTHRHHIDFNRTNNRPDNLVRMGAHPRWRERFVAAQSERASSFWREERYAQIRQRLIEARRNPSDATRSAHAVATTKRFEDPIERGAARLLNCDRSVFRRFPEVVKEARGQPTCRNHKVAAVRELAGEHDVYCLSVPEAGNFALEAGVFVRNCGIIVNVTPLEPAWEGHVTLEFSNTTPLPAKIYAHEGVAQMLFFESDEVCETSYKDRGGKYQGQKGVTLPKT